MDFRELTALELGKKIKNREISAREAVKYTLEQIEKKEKSCHAFLHVMEKYAYAQARKVEEGQKEGRFQGPLAGVPIAVKDNICIKGVPATCASRMLENFVPTYTAEAVRRLEEAGMIPIGKTNMDEFAMGSTTETSAFGPTYNPWNKNHVPGGSSGGSCAAVASGEVLCALGSDTGGSIRQPSGHCGVTGLKPTYGSVSRYGLIAYGSSLDQIGPIGKNVEDCTAILEILAGKDEKDATSMERKEETYADFDGEGICGMKIGIPKEYLMEGIAEGVKSEFMEAVRVLTEQGAIVEFFSLGLVDYTIPAYYIIASAEASSNLERFDGVKYGFRSSGYEGLHEMYKKTRSEGFGAEVKRRIMLGSFVLSSGYYDAYYLKALRVKGMIQKSFQKAFQKYDVLLAPAAPDTAPAIGTSLEDPLKMYLGDIYTVAVNLAGLPGISVPCGLDEKGLPVGIQFIGDCFQEKQMLRAARAYEKARGDFLLPYEQDREGE
ncbi:aspartyl/glutamyl-tRNA amidotransferase subunit A [Blautia sp. An249]|uniref:Asp-tRNA(Asn)/Glu-tRNA(Gln) amidotransferase subunit GatA n=1 Tax=Blautia sp. An249 TaxID=1965603 RepID=UPI000B36EE46|nr:Asp-tRNA(Asn)/Glu-tRNA(Gln) amidotransferase subunit GatA [Blautia sp. An249]OUO78091.1 aspartyl/glutamyl-tRNA amidotransferase subunit A [Blautia sp. An249]